MNRVVKEMTVSEMLDEAVSVSISNPKITIVILSESVRESTRSIHALFESKHYFKSYVNNAIIFNNGARIYFVSVGGRSLYEKIAGLEIGLAYINNTEVQELEYLEYKLRLGAFRGKDKSIYEFPTIVDVKEKIK